LDIDSKSESTDKSAESASVDGRARGRTPVERVVPGKIVVNNPLYKAVFDCETYGLANKATRYSRSQARTLGRRKKDVAQSFGVRSEWDRTPALKVFQFLHKFAKACDDNDVSEAEAFYMVQDFTKEPLRTEVMNVMPSRHGGNPGEVSSNLVLVNWMLRRHVDEADLAAQAELFNRARQGADEDKLSFSERLRQMNVLCWFIHSQGVIKGRFVEGVHKAARATVRERNTPTLSLAELARIAKVKGDEYRWFLAEQHKEREKEGRKMPEVTRSRRSSRLMPYPKAAMPVGVVEPEDPAHLAVAAVPDAPSHLGKKAGSGPSMLTMWPSRSLGDPMPEAGRPALCPVGRSVEGQDPEDHSERGSLASSGICCPATR